jgi:hypothetical protein
MKFLIWSNKHAMWWRANHSGYTQWIEEAGRYDRDDAVALVRRASVGGQLASSRQDPITGDINLCLPVVMVQAPEEIPDLLQWEVTK